MTKPSDVTGKRFGRLIAIEFTGVSRKNQGRMWHCNCDCGGIAIVSVGVLNSGGCGSCGCVVIERGRALGMTTFKHGEGHGRKTKEYRAWTSMKERCYCPTKESYKKYGGRGISVCDKWKADYLAFLLDMGRAMDGQSLDRIDVNGNYEPNNCRWADAETQSRNKTNTKFILIDGKKVKAIDVADSIGVHRNDIYAYEKVKKLIKEKYGTC